MTCVDLCFTFTRTYIILIPKFLFSFSVIQNQCKQHDLLSVSRFSVPVLVQLDDVEFCHNA